MYTNLYHMTIRHLIFPLAPEFYIRNHTAIHLDKILLHASNMELSVMGQSMHVHLVSLTSSKKET